MKILIFVLLLIPIFISSYNLFIIQNVIDPIKYIYTFTGVISVVLLFFTILITLIKKYVNLLKYRRMIGLFGFFYAFLHFLNFIVLDAQFDIHFIFKETTKKPFIYLGMIAFILLLFMALTSTKKLFRKYNKFHKVIYLALLLITIHLIIAQKSLDIYQMFYVLLIIIIGCFKLLQQVRKY
ncbi:sulfite oxidase heme-binding subunit YedZ [Arcobacter sp. CECT 8985]|uniref:sulfite oxidase heme-binding subunit YedZ n=1 Tax=Arcobacter sp. CECT 8985 TaxID=1935424 RepID=UPI00100B572B|nr:ferric reductase-like transmembrane domain-containing protein [Arcobacter sp. CECT 8985]RXJ86103.1 ferric reductase [Arcobacter sp. CECT 8985]